MAGYDDIEYWRNECNRLRVVIQYAVDVLDSEYGDAIMDPMTCSVDEPQPQTMYMRLKQALANK